MEPLLLPGALTSTGIYTVGLLVKSAHVVLFSVGVPWKPPLVRDVQRRREPTWKTCKILSAGC